uniref:vegetative cell wall protein gp1-like n=1 Tax=Macaca mulatta TaxID=9544 RepID=UPI0010A2204B|nr:vegetative cell wall protein gp1-like [Macaca mulatta]
MGPECMAVNTWADPNVDSYKHLVCAQEDVLRPGNYEGCRAAEAPFGTAAPRASCALQGPVPGAAGKPGPGTPSHPGPSPPLPVRPVPGFQVSAPARQAALHLRGIARDSALWILRSSASQIRCPEPVQTWSVGPRPAGPCGSRSRRTSSRSPESAIQPGPPFSSDTRSLRPLRPTDLSDPVSPAKPLGARLHRGGHAAPGSRSQAAPADRWGCSPGQAPLGSPVLLAGPGSPGTTGGKSQARSPPCLRRGASLATHLPCSSSAGRSGAGTGTPRPPG